MLLRICNPTETKVWITKVFLSIPFLFKSYFFDVVCYSFRFVQSSELNSLSELSKKRIPRSTYIHCFVLFWFNFVFLLNDNNTCGFFLFNMIALCHRMLNWISEEKKEIICFVFVILSDVFCIKVGHATILQEQQYGCLWFWLFWEIWYESA